MQYDLAAYDRHGQLVLTVVVKAKRGTDAEWASSFREFLFDEAGYPRPPFFLLATPDRFYLWDYRSPDGEASPLWEFDPKPLLSPYFVSADPSARGVSGYGLELIVSAWLSEVMHAPQPGGGSQYEWLRQSGLLDAIRGGSLAHESPV